MLVGKQHKDYIIRPDKPSTNWALETGEYYLVNEATKVGKALAEKIIQHAPYFDFVLDKHNQLVDIMPTERPEEALEAVQSAKLAELSAACSQAIIAGCDVELSAASGHISLTAEDQINLTAALNAVEQGAAGYPYHLDGQLCAVFSAADIRQLAQAAASHKLYHTTYYNHLAAWVRRSETTEEVQAITYGTALPEDLAVNMANILGGVETENEKV